jgi:hypothetical protein
MKISESKNNENPNFLEGVREMRGEGEKRFIFHLSYRLMLVIWT